MATKQRILGLGNGVLQDICFNAGLHPKRKVNSLNTAEIEKLYKSIINTIQKMINEGGRDTEKDIYGKIGGYKTILSKNTYKNPCPICSGAISKETYLGGAIYYCQTCQKN